MKKRILLAIVIVCVVVCVVGFFAVDEVYRVGVDLLVPTPVGW